MMDEFEKYISENSAEFDQHKADRSKMWAAIESELDAAEPKVIPLWRTRKWRIAAAVIAVFGLLAALTLINRPDGFSGEEQIVSKELLEIDMYYQNLVSAQVQLVQNHPQLSVEDKEEFLAFMDELDEEYEILKLEMSKNLDNERVLEAIVSNYKKRIELIENLLRQINESKKSNDEDVYIL